MVFQSVKKKIPLIKGKNFFFPMTSFNFLMRWSPTGTFERLFPSTLSCPWNWLSSFYMTHTHTRSFGDVCCQSPLGTKGLQGEDSSGSKLKDDLNKKILFPLVFVFFPHSQLALRSEGFALGKRDLERRKYPTSGTPTTQTHKLF